MHKRVEGVSRADSGKGVEGAEMCDFLEAKRGF